MKLFRIDIYDMVDIIIKILVVYFQEQINDFKVFKGGIVVCLF